MKSLKKILVIYIACLCNCSFGQTSNTNKDSCRYLLPVVNKDSIYVDRDSVLNRFLTYGAWKYPLNSIHWQNYIDSGIAIIHNESIFWHQKSMPFFKSLKYEIGLSYLDSAVKYDTRKWIDYRAFIKCIFIKNYKDALVDFKLSKKINGDGSIMDHSYNFYIGLCYLQLNQFDTALYYLNLQANKVTQERGAGWVHYLDRFYMGITNYELALHHSSLEEMKIAIQCFDTAIKIYSKFSDAKFYKSLALIAIGKYEEAELLLKEAKEDLLNHFTINEDNVLYERYPYQISLNLVDTYLNWIGK
jgi:tetratricopeptide (TPR) repeat protein